MINVFYFLMPTLLLPSTAAAPTGNDYLRDTGERKSPCLFISSAFNVEPELRAGIYCCLQPEVSIIKLEKHTVKSDLSRRIWFKVKRFVTFV